MKRTFVQMKDINLSTANEIKLISSKLDKKIPQQHNTPFTTDETSNDFNRQTFTQSSFGNCLKASRKSTEPRRSRWDVVSDKGKMFESADDALSFYEKQLNLNKPTNELFTAAKKMERQQICFHGEKPCAKTLAPKIIFNGPSETMTFEFPPKPKSYKLENAVDGDEDDDIFCNKSPTKKHKSNKFESNQRKSNKVIGRKRIFRQI